jgi:murein L,D-transpeptidase YafK
VKGVSAAFRLVVALLATLLLAACQDGDFDDLAPKAQKDLPQRVLTDMKAKGMTRSSPIMVRVFKEENVLEVWKRADTGRYVLIAEYDICKWSGKLGPKFIEGDRQAPEGFYTITPGQMNPNSKYHLAFNTGFPNAFDRANGRNGTHLMVHGDCSSSGCYSMTDPQMEEIFAFARFAFNGGQKSFQMQAFPFRMTPENMARYRNDPNYAFWQNIKEGYDLFELTKVPPRVGVCDRKYTFAAGVTSGDAPMEACKPDENPPALAAALSSYKADFNADMQAAIEQKSYDAPAPTVQGIKEAKLVADWSKRRNRGERVSREPPSLTPAGEVVTAATAPAATPATAGAAPDQQRFGNGEMATTVAAITATQTAVSTTATASVEAAPAAPAGDAAAGTPVAAAPTAGRLGTNGEVAVAAADGTPLPQANPNAPSLTAVSPDAVPIPARKKPWWKILGD